MYCETRSAVAGPGGSSVRVASSRPVDRRAAGAVALAEHLGHGLERHGAGPVALLRGPGPRRRRRDGLSPGGSTGSIVGVGIEPPVPPCACPSRSFATGRAQPDERVEPRLVRDESDDAVARGRLDREAGDGGQPAPQPRPVVDVGIRLAARRCQEAERRGVITVLLGGEQLRQRHGRRAGRSSGVDGVLVTALRATAGDHCNCKKCCCPPSGHAPSSSRTANPDERSSRRTAALSACAT